LELFLVSAETSLRLSENNRTLSTSRSERGYQEIKLVKFYLYFELQLGSNKDILKGGLIKHRVESTASEWVFVDEVTKIIFSMDNNITLSVKTYRRGMLHAHVELIAQHELLIQD
jgi:hypothetical protein